MGLKGLAALLLSFVVVFAGQASSVAAGSPTTVADDASRAESAYNGMQHRFYVSTAALYRPAYPRDAGQFPFSFHWPFSQAMAATIDMYAYSDKYADDMAARLGGLAVYWDKGARPPGYDAYVRRPYGDGGDMYYDDNAWSGLDLERIYHMTGSTSALSQAEKAFAFGWSGWDSKAVCSGSAGSGGIYWKQQTPSEPNHDRNTVSTAPNIELALRLYQDTGKRWYLDRAVQMYDWMDSYLRDSKDGLYWDHVGPGANGESRIEKSKSTYNQGTMLGATVILYQVTGQRSYLDRARSIARAALSLYGCANGCTAESAINHDGPAFNAVFFRNLLLLSAVDRSNPSYRRAMQSYADLIWNNTALRKTKGSETLFYFQRDHVALLDQAAMVEIYAQLAWDDGKLNQDALPATAAREPTLLSASDRSYSPWSCSGCDALILADKHTRLSPDWIGRCTLAGAMPTNARQRRASTIRDTRWLEQTVWASFA